MLAILKKEFKSYFLSPIGYVFVAVFMYFSAKSFSANVLDTHFADIGWVFLDFNLWYLFLVSILTMKLFAEEKNKKTDQLLLSSPVSVTEIVLGKYLAAMIVFGITVVLSFIYLIIMSTYANPAFSEILSSYIGFVLLWGALISVGVFISALTESQTIASVITFSILYIIFSITEFVEKIGVEILQKALGFFDVFERYREFQNGIVDIGHVVYFLSFTFIFLFLTVRVIDKRRYS